MDIQSQPNNMIDYLVRTTAKDLPFLLPLLRSIEIFLMDKITGKLIGGGEFFVIFDDESVQDHYAASMLPSWVTVVFEPMPVNLHFPESITGAGNHVSEKVVGWMRSQYSNFYSDRWGKSPFIGIFDADSMVKAFCGHEVQFFDKEHKPRIFCTQHRDLGMIVPRSIDIEFASLNPWSCMESFPFIFRREDFNKVREWLVEKTGIKDESNSFNKAYENLLSRMGTDPLSMGQFALLGAWAYTYNKNNYSWSIGGNGPLSTCAELRVGVHLAYFGDWEGLPKLRYSYYFYGMELAFEGICRATCSSDIRSAECSQYLARSSRHEALLSLEGANEMMFGSVRGKPGCEDHENTIFHNYESCLQKRCSLG
jgi:hypothetical protein